MKKSLFVILFSFLWFHNFFAQNGYNEFWDKLLNNDRESAELLLKNIKTEDINKLVINEILREEEGMFFEDKSFIEQFLKEKDFEYYLYALWNKVFLFDSYLTSGFNKRNKRNIQEVNKVYLKNSTIKDAITYLNAVTAREKNNWDQYFNSMDSIKAIKNWEYCGVFENLNKSGLDRYYEPETKAKSETDFDARSNGFVNWYTAKNTKEAYQFFTNHNEFGEGVNYAQTFITANNDERVILRIGSSSAFKIWLNDVLVYQNTEDVITELNAYNLELTIPKGTNRLLFKLAESNSVSYFIATILGKDNQPQNNLKYSSVVEEYNKSNYSDINPKSLENEFETYFINKTKEFPNDFFYAYCLTSTYLRNSKFKEAKNVLTPYYKKYPKSSLIRKMLMIVNSSEGDNVGYNEIKKNIELDDPNYYLPLVLKVARYSDLNRMSMNELEEFIVKLKKNVHNEIMNLTADFVYNARKEDFKGIKKNLNELVNTTKDNLKLQIRYAPLYGTLFNEENKTMDILEEINEKYFDYSAIKTLSGYYEKKNEIKKDIELLSKDIDYFSEDNSYLITLIQKLHSYKKFKESLPYIDMALSNFPYSFQVLELKGDALVQVNKIDEAIESYEKSLKYNSGNNSLRKKIKDLKKEPNLLNELAIKQPYEYIKNNRGKIKMNNYGYNILLDDSNIEIYNEGGGKYKFTFMYEITSDNGVESFKEYDLGLSGNYHINKSEVVKLDGSIVPAEKSRSSFVFNSLAIGDVVYIDYENSFSSTGRFYKDFSDLFMFDSYHPMLKSSLRLITPRNFKLFYKVTNGKLEPKISQLGSYDLYDWTIQDTESLPQVEDYMPNNVDVARYLHISTIPDWNEISTWYSDLVRSSIEENQVVKDAFNHIFPKGFSQLSEETRAKSIYNYIKNNFTYSYVNFKQSGFIPQKPSKTIKTGLGDCKDFSTLYVTLAKMANLRANLVLILTSDNGNELVLPSTDFNHCIVKVKLDGKDQFLELTDKYLPFKALPTALRGALALEIPFNSDADKKQDLFRLDNVSREKSVFENDVVVNISEESIKMRIDTKFTGHINSYYASLLADPNAEVVKKSINDELKTLIEEDFTLDDLTNVERVDDDRIIKYTSNITLNEKINKIGSINVFQLPMVSNPYTSSIINYEKRNYPIEYLQYEKLDEYYNSYDLLIDDGKRFIEIPENSKFSFKDHRYEITYELVKDNHLKVKIYSKPSYKNIDPDDYAEFKAYVKSILDAEKKFIGFK